MLNARISILVSGGGTNLQALLDAQVNGVLRSGKVVQVISSRAGVRAIERAHEAGIRTDVAEYREFPNREAFERRLMELLTQSKPDVIVLAGFLQILSADFVSRWEGRIVNVHPSLLPAFCGKGFYGLRVHEAVLEAGLKVTGATVHLVTAEPDKGTILMQRAVDVLPDDSPELLQHRVMEQAEWRILPQAVEDLCHSLAPSPSDFCLRGNRYPGRGIILGCGPNGRAVLAYFIMGRSAGSRARAFRREKDDVVIRLLDQSGVKDPSLILYAPLRMCGRHIVVANGDQTDAICTSLKGGKGFEEALRTMEYEPDAPHFTPRISGMISLPESGFSYRLSILKASGAGRRCQRQFFEYEPIPGMGHLIHTYAGDGAVLPSFAGEPLTVNVPSSIDAFTNGLWEALDEENRVALYVRYTPLDGSRYEDRVVNRYGEEAKLR